MQAFAVASLSLLALTAFSGLADASHYSSHTLGTAVESDWQRKYGEQFDMPFSGPLSFSHLPYHLCLDDNAIAFDIALLGMPFDTGVTYRPGYAS